MKKFIFSIFAICMCGPSFANICSNRKVIDGNKLLFYNSILNTLGEYTECDTNNDKRLMVGCDGKIYKCNDKKWELAYIQKHCPSGWGDATSQRIKPKNTIANPTDTGDIYFFTSDQKIYVLEDSICKYTTNKCNNDYDECIKDGRVPVDCTICDPAAGGRNTFTKCIYVKNGEKNISDVKFLYNGFKIKTNRETSIAKYDSASKCYLIEWHPENNDNVTVSAQGFTPITMKVKALLNTDSIQLSTDGSANSRQNTPDTNSAFELQYNEKTNLTCTKSRNDSNTTKCKLNTQVIDIDGNLQECTSTGWKKINKESASCTGTLAELEGKYRDIDLGTSIYNAFHGKESEHLPWVYFFDYDKDNCMGAIKKTCKYSFEDYKESLAQCERKGGEFLSHYDDSKKIIECDTRRVQNKTIRVMDNEQNPLDDVNITHRDQPYKTDSNGLVTLPLIPDNASYKIIFQKNGYEDKIIKNTAELFNNLKVYLNPVSNPAQTVPTGTKENECKNSGGDDYKDGKCICSADDHLEEYSPDNEYSICRCMNGYHRDGTPDENGKYPANGKCVDAGDYETHEEFDSAAWRKDTEDAYRNEYDNAQSWANKGVTAASTLMTGEGAMMAARAIAEQKADKKAEEQMAEWISKMGCEYGNGQQVNLGKEETLPAGDLAKYYAEYKQLADKLKATKTALNLRPGIESEVLYDRAETGLYQYQTAERQSGGFTSLSRALMNPDGTDAEQWNAQKAEVAKDLTTGTLLTAGGLLVGASNILVNRNHKKEYKDLIQKTTNVIKKIERDYPQIFIIPTEQEPVVEVTEETPAEKPRITTTVKVTTSDKTFDSSTFDSGYITLTEIGKNALTTAATGITNSVSETYTITSINITADGYTDPDPIKSKWVSKLKQQYENNIGSLPEYYEGKIDSNPKLSKARAEMVTNFLKERFDAVLSSIEISTEANGHGDTECKNKKRDEYPSCRKVDLKIVVTGTETTTVTE